MAYDGVVYAGTVGEINVAAAGAISVLNPLLTQIDISLFGSFGISSLQADLQAQISAAASAQLDIGLGLANPFAGFQIALAAIVQLQAQISLALSGAIPAIGLDALAQISALVALQAQLSVRVGIFDAMIQGGIAVKLPAASFSAGLGLNLGLGPVMVLSFSDVALAAAGIGIGNDFTSGLVEGPVTISPGETVYGIVLVTKAPAAWAAMQATLRTT
jgi:hypothetical protein